MSLGMTVVTDGLVIETFDASHELVIKVSGELDLMTAPVLKAALDGVSADKPIVVECSGVQFMDSSGLYVFLVESKRIGKTGWSLRLRNASIPVRHVLEIAGFESLLEATAQEQA